MSHWHEKERFPIIAYEYRLNPENYIVIVATTVLNFLLRQTNEPEPHLPWNIDQDEL